jgi:isopenicillin-N epimerase
MPTRRDVLSALGLPLAASLTSACLSEPARRALEPFTDGPELTPEEVAADEARWAGLQSAFTVDRSVVNLNNGGCCPSPWVVQDAHKRRLDFSNQLPTHNLWQVLEPQRESSRAGLARLFGCDSEEIALTRNASESLETCLLGMDLARGDEVLTSDQDYPRMLTALDQRARREGVVVHKVELPTPCEDEAELVRRFEERLTPRTRLMLICHVINLTGQVLPVRAIVQMARRHGVPVVVDGAHGFAHLLDTRDELDVDYYGTSLHKWLLAPHGTGMLYVRKEKIGALWPLMAAPESMQGDVRKFEEIGTHPAAQLLAIGEALVFHHAIGSANKLARLRYLRDRWAQRLTAASERVVLNTSLSPRFGAGYANFRVEGLDTLELQRHLWSKHRILTTAIVAPFPAVTHGLRITPNVYTTLEELDRFGDVVEQALEKGLSG